MNNEVTLINIESSCTKLSHARSLLNAKLIALQSELDAVRRGHINSIRKTLAKVEALTESTRALVASAPALFEKPKTTTLAGIKVGFQKGKARLEIADAEETIARIRKVLPDTADNYIQTEHSPIRAALAQLPAALQKRVGVKLIEGEDEVVVRPQDNDIEGLCKALLGGE